MSEPHWMTHQIDCAGDCRLEALLQRARAQAFEEAARFVSLASVSDPSPLDGIGSMKLSEMNETARTAIHAACQTLAMDLRALAQKPEGA